MTKSPDRIRRLNRTEANAVRARAAKHSYYADRINSNGTINYLIFMTIMALSERLIL